MQARPQPPQFDASVARFTHAVGVETGQAVVPEGHWQIPAEHSSPVSWHANPDPQPPQFFGSVAVFAQYVPQSSGYAEPWTQSHVPFTQPEFCFWQTFPHPPQLSLSFCGSTQSGFCPVHAMPPWLHVHAPALHVPNPHRIPHPPQFAGSVAYVAGSVQMP